MPSAEAIRKHIRELLVVAVETKASHYHEEHFRRGIQGAILEGRTNTLEEILDWIQPDTDAKVN